MLKFVRKHLNRKLIFTSSQTISLQIFSNYKGGNGNFMVKISTGCFLSQVIKVNAAISTYQHLSPPVWCTEKVTFTSVVGLAITNNFNLIHRKTDWEIVCKISDKYCSRAWETSKAEELWQKGREKETWRLMLCGFLDWTLGEGGSAVEKSVKSNELFS